MIVLVHFHLGVKSKYYVQEAGNEVCSILRTHKYFMPNTKFIHLGDVAPDICAPLFTSTPLIIMSALQHTED